jgi:hypothetical protein
LKKIDCISAVNVLPGDPLNFPDLDISNLLMSESHRASIMSTSTVLNPEIGRKSFSLGTPFSTPSSNALQGSDFASVIGDSDFGSMNDHDTMDHEIFPLRQISNNISSYQSENFEFNVPDELRRQKRAKQKIQKFKNSLMDHELMLEKDKLFINENELLKQNFNDNFFSSNPFKVALDLLNNPDEQLFESSTIFKTTKLNFSYETRKAEQNKNKSIIPMTISSSNNEDSVDYIMDNDDYRFDDGIEVYRNDPNSRRLSMTSSSTPSNLMLPWSSSSVEKSRNHFLSAIQNTPIRKGLQSTLSPLTDLSATPSSSLSSASSPFKQFSTSLSNETFDFFYFLQDTIENSDNTKIFTFETALPKAGTSRAVAARAFHHLLELKTANLVKVKQSRPFSSIEILID